MNKADKMFKKLGYIKDIESDFGLIRYNNKDSNYIRFVIQDKTVDMNKIIDNEIYPLPIDMELLYAINEKVKELQWI